MQKCTAVRTIEWDMGHRVPAHKSKCFNVHGHRYVMNVHVEAPVITSDGDSSEGMVIDFGDLKKYVGDFIDKYLDHGYMGHHKMDEAQLLLLESLDMKHVAVNFTPTAENMAVWLFEQIDNILKAHKHPDQSYLRLQKLVLYETPKNFVEINRDDMPSRVRHEATKMYYPNRLREQEALSG